MWHALDKLLDIFESRLLMGAREEPGRERNLVLEDNHFSNDALMIQDCDYYLFIHNRDGTYHREYLQGFVKWRTIYITYLKQKTPEEAQDIFNYVGMNNNPEVDIFLRIDRQLLRTFYRMIDALIAELCYVFMTSKNYAGEMREILFEGEMYNYESSQQLVVNLLKTWPKVVSETSEEYDKRLEQDCRGLNPVLSYVKELADALHRDIPRVDPI